ILTREQRMTGFMVRNGRLDPTQKKPDAATWLRGALTGDWGRDPELRAAMAEGTPSLGGAIVPTPLAASIFDKARAQSVVFTAGVGTLPMTSATLKVARVTADPTISWNAENNALTPTNPTFDTVTFTAQTAALVV